jgi:hypothetical protein
VDARPFCAGNVLRQSLHSYRSISISAGINRADSFMDVAFLFTLKAVQHIPAQNIHFVLPGDLVPEVFDLNCRIRLPLRPQNRRTFTTDCNARRLPLRPFHGFLHEIARDLEASSRVRQIIHHESRERDGLEWYRLRDLSSGAVFDSPEIFWVQSPPPHAGQLDR